MPVPSDPKRDDGKPIGQEPQETTRATAPADTGNRDTEPEEDIIPHSAKALADYHDGLKELSEAARHHHGALLDEMHKHCKKMEHPEIRPQFEKWLGDHTAHLNKMLDAHESMCKDMAAAFEKHHPDLEALTASAAQAPNVDKPQAPARTTHTSEPHTSRTIEQERETGPGKTTVASHSAAPVQTKTAAVEEELDPAMEAVILNMLDRIEKKSIEQEQRFARETVGAR